MKKGLLFFAAAAIIGLGSCKKDDDNFQPKGNYGVITSSNTVTLNNWSSDYDDGTEFIYSSRVSWPEITQNIVNTGLVMVYMSDGAGSWYALPYTDAGSDYSYTTQFGITSGAVDLMLSGYDLLGSPGASSNNGTVVRIVAIDNAGKIANNDLDWKNYNAVAARLGLDKKK
jgi:hypothetical protein